MPRGDGTGPMGMGPMTGRGAGYYAGYTSGRFANQRAGSGMGIGGGRGYRRMFCLTGLPRWARNGYSEVNPDIPAVNAKTALKEQEAILERQLQLVKDRLKDIDE